MSRLTLSRLPTAGLTAGSVSLAAADSPGSESAGRSGSRCSRPSVLGAVPGLDFVAEWVFASGVSDLSSGLLPLRPVSRVVGGADGIVGGVWPLVSGVVVSAPGVDRFGGAGVAPVLDFPPGTESPSGIPAAITGQAGEWVLYRLSGAYRISPVGHSTFLRDGCLESSS
ncbi:hypothetical protein [Nocardia jejuensis]|uniref:hypothetical protein n=1 Tax=Nocardia jejuensis TaxID=328049 RepID=UPI0012FCC5EC|nr:hypothetical protein [Nocardia jejuensis]